MVIKDVNLVRKEGTTTRSAAGATIQRHWNVKDGNVTFNFNIRFGSNPAIETFILEQGDSVRWPDNRAIVKIDENGNIQTLTNEGEFFPICTEEFLFGRLVAKNEILQ